MAYKVPRNAYNHHISICRDPSRHVSYLCWRSQGTTLVRLLLCSSPSMTMDLWPTINIVKVESRTSFSNIVSAATVKQTLMTLEVRSDVLRRIQGTTDILRGGHLPILLETQRIEPNNKQTIRRVLQVDAQRPVLAMLRL